MPGRCSMQHRAVGDAPYEMDDPDCGRVTVKFHSPDSIVTEYSRCLQATERTLFRRPRERGRAGSSTGDKAGEIPFDMRHGTGYISDIPAGGDEAGGYGEST
jgi:hypothetical protein